MLEASQPSRGKIVLIQLPSPWLINDRDLPLMGILSLAASLRAAGVEVQIADLVGIPEDRWYIPEADVYGVSLTTPQAPLAKRAIEIVRQRTKHHVTCIAGGSHVSALPEWALRHLDLDYAFVGESDDALVQFMQGAPVDTVPGLVWNDNSTIRRNPMPVVDLTPLHLPARDMVDIRSFHQVGINRYVTDNVRYEGYLQTGRGCPYDCAFCAQAAITGRRARFFTNEFLINEVDELVNRYEVDLIYIEDDTFNINKHRVKELCELFATLNFKWHCLCRADSMSDEMAHQLAAGGCQSVTFGFETGSDRVLKLMRKCETMDDAWKALRSVHAAGLGVRGQMIVGFPGETEQDLLDTERFVKEAAPYVSKWGFHAFVPLPGTHVWRHPEKYDIHIDTSTETFAEGFHTIGKPGEWARVWGDEARTRDWLHRLREVAAIQNIDVTQSDHDANFAASEELH